MKQVDQDVGQFAAELRLVDGADRSGRISVPLLDDVDRLTALTGQAQRAVDQEVLRAFFVNLGEPLLGGA